VERRFPVNASCFVKCIACKESSTCVH
jgi:hypothetical protein